MSPMNRQLAAEEMENNPLIEALMCLVEDYGKDYEFPRQWLLQEIRRNDLYYQDIQNIWISDNANDWRSFDDIGSLGADPANANLNTDFNFKFINIYRAYADSLIAALSVAIPATRFLPENADNIDDIQTAESFGKIATLIRKNNKAKLFLIKLLAILYNHGCVAAYNYCDRDSKFGQATVPVRGIFNKALVKKICSVCGNELESILLPAEIVEDSNTEQYSNDDNNNPEQSIDENDTMLCPNCNIAVTPITETTNNLQKGIVDYKDVDKIRERIEAYGMSHVSFPPFVTSQGQIPVLEFDHEEDISLVEEMYSHLKGKIEETNSDTPEENKWARQNRLYYGEVPKHTCTVKEYWIRPWAFNRIKDNQYVLEIISAHENVPQDVISPEATDNPDDSFDNTAYNSVGQNNPDTNSKDIDKLSEYLKQKYPKGLRLVLINGKHYAEHHEEDLDEHWTISINPTQEHLIAKSIGSGVIPVQDIKNDLVNLKVETVQHGIPENFVQQEIIDWNRYSKVEQRPGNVFPVNTNPNKSVADNFHQTKPASLSQEVEKFDESIQKDGQFVTGAVPSIYGGSMEGSDTAAEYSMSRAQALQRLLITWASICELWSTMEYKAVKDFAANLDYDERFVEKTGASAKNIWVKQITLKGEVADIEPEASETFPLTWGQKNDLIFKLMGLNNDKVNEILGHPENIGKVATYIGSSELYIPGDDQRNKQLAEIAELVKIDPLQGEALLNGQQSTVPIEPDVDGHEVHSEVCKAWLVSMVGQQTKRDSPEAYLNVLLHKKQHDFLLAQEMASMLKMQAQVNGKDGMNNEQKDNKNVQPIS